MVDSVSSFGGKIRTGATASAQSVAAGQGANSAAVAAATQLSRPAGAKNATASGGDVLSLSAQALDLPAELKMGPPLDTAQVSKIKSAIAEGNYPINLDAIKDAMFQAWNETIN